MWSAQFLCKSRNDLSNSLFKIKSHLSCSCLRCIQGRDPWSVSSRCPLGPRVPWPFSEPRRVLAVLSRGLCPQGSLFTCRREPVLPAPQRPPQGDRLCLNEGVTSASHFPPEEEFPASSPKNVKVLYLGRRRSGACHYIPSLPFGQSSLIFF